MSRPVNDFLDAIESDRGLWRSLDVRVFAVFAEGAWRNVITFAVLHPEDSEHVARLSHPVRNALVRGEQRVFPIDELAAFIESVESGSWPPDDPVRYENPAFADGQRTPKPYDFGYTQFYSLDPPQVRPELLWSARSLVAHGDSAGTVIQRVPRGYDELQQTARQHRYPFETSERLAEHVLGISPGLIGSRATSCEIVAPYGIRIEKDAVHLDDGVATVTVVAESRLAASMARLQVTTRPASLAAPKPTILPATDRWPDSGSGPWLWSGSVEVGEVDEVAFVLHCGVQTLQWVRRQAFRARGQSVPLAVYSSLDPKLEKLRRFLRGDKTDGKRQDHLEEGVGRLLTLSGFRVDRYGADELRDGVDLVAYAPDENLCLTIECTTGSITAGGKLGKFVARAADIRRVISPIEVTAIMATSLSRDAVARADWRHAYSSGVLVAPQELLMEVLGLVSRGAGVRAVLEVLARGGSPPVSE